MFFRIGNKIEYLNVGLRKIIHPPCKNLQHGVRLEVDGKLVILPQLEGLIILNILRYTLHKRLKNNQLYYHYLILKLGIGSQTMGSKLQRRTIFYAKPLGWYA